jgi:hypothetical protein
MKNGGADRYTVGLSLPIYRRVSHARYLVLCHGYACAIGGLALVIPKDLRQTQHA